ncbi:MAG: hypothetical protein V2I33_16860 [Kangiellaceae bacterium]|jgi:hypothetical protein|nr:hypothetical protein [Kangiellaceae bacterium]
MAQLPEEGEGHAPNFTLDNALRAFGVFAAHQNLSIGEGAFTQVSQSIFEASSHADVTDSPPSPNYQEQIDALKSENRQLKEDIFKAENILNHQHEKIEKLKKRVGA